MLDDTRLKCSDVSTTNLYSQVCVACVCMHGWRRGEGISLFKHVRRKAHVTQLCFQSIVVTCSTNNTHYLHNCKTKFEQRSSISPCVLSLQVELVPSSLASFPERGESLGMGLQLSLTVSNFSLFLKNTNVGIVDASYLLAVFCESVGTDDNDSATSSKNQQLTLQVRS